MANIDNYLIRQIISKRVVPFIGAGFSRDFGYPGWGDLLKKVMHEIQIDNLDPKDIDEADPLQVAQAFLDYFKETNYENFENSLIQEIGIAEETKIRDKLNQYLSSSIKKEIDQRLEREFSKIVLEQIKHDEELVNPTNIEKLKLLGDLDFKQILTTNYDDVLEHKVFDTKNYQVLSLGNGDELNWDDSYNTIYKIHGDVRNHKEIIFTHAQYYKFMHQFGYFRSKLYTLFSSNVILMMGYGFNDINIHQIYFQFIRDYDNESSLDDKKFYMVLTKYDKKRWGTYFDYYKRYLSSYKINVIEVETLPDFIEELSETVKLEIASSDLNSLLNFYQDNNKDKNLFTDVLMKVFNNSKDIPLSNNHALNLDILKAFHKIYKGPYILNDNPFNKSVDSDGLEHEVARSMFKYTNKLARSFKDLIENQEFIEIVNDSLDFIDKTGDFYEIRDRIIDFIELSNNLKQTNYSREDNLIVGKKMSNMFHSSHPTEYLRSNPGGRILKEKLTNISPYHINCFLSYLDEEQENEQLLTRLQRYWLKELQAVTHGETEERINKILEQNKKLKAEF
ncbi:SIR2 family protein [Bacillus halotolerans]|uniref:SIR2 family protein n=1 Tax=Bacillus halotolerans TaxID=260554 RepID=UPI003825E0B7